MKKIFTMVVLALTTLTMSAQDDSKFTIKAGAGLSTLVGSDVNNVESVFSYKVGLSYDWNITEKFLITPGIEFATKGFKVDGIVGDISMSYLQLPILAAYKFNITDNIKIAVKAGPYLSYGIFGSDIEWYGGGETNVFDSDGGYNRFDAGAIAGVSVEFSQYMVGVEYSRGLTKLDSDYKQYNQAFGVVFGYKF